MVAVDELVDHRHQARRHRGARLETEAEGEQGDQEHAAAEAEERSRPAR